MSGTNNFGPYYDNTGTSPVNPWGYPVPGVNSPNNTNQPNTQPPNPPNSIHPSGH